MSVLNQLAYFQNRRDEVPNQELARQLATAQDRAGIQEIAANLWNKDKNIQSDCLKVLYEIGYLQPALIADYVPDFLRLLKSENNRLVWGAMIGLGTVAALRVDDIWASIDDVIQAMKQGSLITVVWGVKVFAAIAAAQPQYSAKLFPILIDQLKVCLPRDVPTHAEHMLGAVNAVNQPSFLAVLAGREAELTPAQKARLKKILRQLKQP